MFGGKLLRHDLRRIGRMRPVEHWVLKEEMKEVFNRLLSGLRVVGRREEV